MNGRHEVAAAKTPARLFGLLVLVEWVALAGCAALPVALDVAAGVGFGAAGVVQRRWQTEEIRALREEMQRLREAVEKNGEGKGAAPVAARREEGWW